MAELERFPFVPADTQPTAALENPLGNAALGSPFLERRRSRRRRRLCCRGCGNLINRQHLCGWGDRFRFCVNRCFKNRLSRRLFRGRDRDLSRRIERNRTRCRRSACHGRRIRGCGCRYRSCARSLSRGADGDGRGDGGHNLRNDGGLIRSRRRTCRLLGCHARGDRRFFSSRRLPQSWKRRRRPVSDRRRNGMRCEGRMHRTHGRAATTQNNERAHGNCRQNECPTAGGQNPCLATDSTRSSKRRRITRSARGFGRFSRDRRRFNRPWRRNRRLCRGLLSRGLLGRSLLPGRRRRQIRCRFDGSDGGRSAVSVQFQYDGNLLIGLDRYFQITRRLTQILVRNIHRLSSNRIR